MTQSGWEVEWRLSCLADVGHPPVIISLGYSHRTFGLYASRLLCAWRCGLVSPVNDRSNLPAFYRLVPLVVRPS